MVRYLETLVESNDKSKHLMLDVNIVDEQIYKYIFLYVQTH